MVDQPDNMEERRKAYAESNFGQAVGDNKAQAGFGFYGDFGGGLYAPPVEFAGTMFDSGMGLNNATFSPMDAFSHPARYGNGFGGYAGKEGWVYGRGSNNINHLRIAQCLLLYKTEGIVQTIVHLLADFVVESVDIIHADQTVHNFYQAWKTKVKLKERLHRFVVDLLTTGNVFIWTREAKLKDSDKTSMKRGFACKMVGKDLVLQMSDSNGRLLKEKTVSVQIEDDQLLQLHKLSEACNERASAGLVNEVVEAGTRNDPTDPEASNEQDKKAVKIPWDYISLNPLQMEPRGSRFANEHYWVMMLSERDMRPLSRFMSYRYYTDISTTKVNLPEPFKGNLRKNQNPRSPYAAELVLDADRLSVIQDVTKADYEDWATPQIYPANKEVAFKRMLRMGEASAMESLKHTITLIKLGDTKEGFAPTAEQIDRVAAALAGGAQVHHLVWDDLIEGQVLQPQVDKIFDPKKYEQVDKDIFTALGVTQAVMTGEASYANSFMAIKLLLEKLETIREKLEDWLRVEIKKISDVMKFRRMPNIQWGIMNLRDENAERKLWLDLYDRGIVSDQSLLEQFGTDFDIEKARQEIEKTYKDENNKEIKKDDKKFRAPLMVSKGPFNRDLQPPKQAAKPSGGKGGRPVKTGKPQSKKRNTKPKGMGAIQDFNRHIRFATGALAYLNDIATELVVKQLNVKDSRSLTKAQKEGLEITILNTLAALNPNGELTKDLVYNALTSENSTFSEEKCQRILALYQDQVETVNTKEDRFDLMCNIFAAVNANLLEEEEDDDGELDDNTSEG